MVSGLLKLPAIVFALILSSTPSASTSASPVWQEPVQPLHLRAGTTESAMGAEAE